MDETFGDEGWSIWQSDLYDLYPNAIVVKADQKIYVSGSTSGVSGINVFLACFNPNGQASQFFGTDGMVTTSIPNRDLIGRAIVIHPDGHILVGGTSYNGLDYDCVLLKYSPEPLHILKSSNNLTCSNIYNGEASVYVAGGAPPYSIHWSNDGNDFTLSNLSSGTYYFTVTDAADYSISDSIIIDTPPAIIVSIDSVVNTSCYGENSGRASISITGGVPPFDIQWSNGTMSLDALNLSAGIYRVSVADMMGCSDSIEITITEPPLIIPELAFIRDPNCADQPASIFVSPTGGRPPYQFSWSTGEVEDQIEVSSGSFGVTITDSVGCFSADSIQVPEIQPIHISGVVIPASGGNEDGSISAIVSGGTPPFNFLWFFNGQLIRMGDLLLNAAGGDYLLTVIDAEGCMKDSIFSIPIVNSAKELPIIGKVEIFPNPFKEIIKIRLELNSIESLCIDVIDLRGHIAWSQIFPPLNKLERDLDISALPAGFYFLRIRMGQSTLLRKIVKS